MQARNGEWVNLRCRGAPFIGQGKARSLRGQLLHAGENGGANATLKHLKWKMMAAVEAVRKWGIISLECARKR